MTLRELLKLIGSDVHLLIPVLLGPPVLAFVLGLLHGKDRGNATPWKHLYSVLVYAACLPGLLAATITVYAIGFAHENLLDLQATVYVLPVVAMLATLVLVGRNADFNELPGFGRLAGLMTLIVLMFVIVLVIEKTRVMLLFGGSIWILIGFAAFVFALLKWGAYMAFRTRGAPPRPAPRFSPLAGDDQ